jgi:hypothetical protein
MCVTQFFLLAGWHERRIFLPSPKKEKKATRHNNKDMGRRRRGNTRTREKEWGWWVPPQCFTTEQFCYKKPMDGQTEHGD